jgi:V/A-type H+-transporting ATPase subunit K
MRIVGILAAIAILAAFVMAQHEAAQVPVITGDVTKAGRYIGAGIAVGFAAGGAGAGVGIAGAAAISGTVEKPERLVWYLIFVALAEACAIYGLLVGLMLTGG